MTLLVSARILQDWFHAREALRQQAAKSPVPSFVSYVIVHTNSSLFTHLCLVAIIALGALQILLVWRWRRLARRWWLPPMVELVLCVLFSIAAAQVLGHYVEGCTGSSVPGMDHCVVQLPLIFHDGWVALFAIAGIAIGLLWTWTARMSLETTASDESLIQSEVSPTAF